MQLGLIHINMGSMSRPDALARAARAAEFAAVGVRRLVLLAPPDPDGAARTVEADAAAMAGLR
jgi:hypothetical protein